MTEPLILKTNEKPSFFNKEMAIGALLGLCTANPSLLAVATVIGACIGQNRMARENKYGKIIDVHTSSSKDTLLGAILGSQVGTGIAALALRSADIPNLSLGQKAIFAGAGIAGMLVGGYTGTKHGVSTYENEYAEALSQQQERQVSRSKTLESNLGLSTTPVNNYSATILAEREQSSKLQSR